MASVVSSPASLDPIYNPEFTYSLPRPLLEKMFSGLAFDNKEPYTKEEMQQLNEDMAEIFAEAIAGVHPGEPNAVISAGAPGAGKTTLMERLLEDESSVRKVSYIDPDAVCLKKMRRTYLEQIEGITGTAEEQFAQRKAAYDKWRPASNAINHWILANLIKGKYPFYFGTTSSSPQTRLFYEFLKQQGYEIRVVHVTAPDGVRWQSIQERDKTFVQTTEEDVVVKGRLVYERINDTFFALADTIFFDFRPTLDSPAKLAATWTRSDGSLKVYDQDAFDRVKALHGDHWPVGL